MKPHKLIQYIVLLLYVLEVVEFVLVISMMLWMYFQSLVEFVFPTYTVMAVLVCTLRFRDLTPSVKLYLDNSICSQLDGAIDEFRSDLLCVNFLIKDFQFLVFLLLQSNPMFLQMYHSLSIAQMSPLIMRLFPLEFETNSISKACYSHNLVELFCKL